MSDVIITVRGESEVRTAPERAAVTLNVRAEGADRAAVVAEVRALAEPVRQGVLLRKESGVVSEWSSSRMTVRTERPWGDHGVRLAPVHHADISFTAAFTDAVELSEWVSAVAVLDGVEVGATDWQLTPETRARVEQEVASDAVSVAVARARAYAAALGLGTVAPVEIADRGMISHQEVAMPRMKTMHAGLAMRSGDAAFGMVFEAEDIVVAATVEARFRAS